MSISINDSVLWTKLSWEKSFEKTVNLDDILPQIGVIYPVVFDGDHAPTKSGKLFILWKPPHSELNGWSDKRPSEILSSFVLEGELRYRRGKKNEFEFFFTKISKLIELFDQVREDKNSPLSKYKLPDGRSVVYWENLDHMSRSTVGKYIYLNASGDVGVHLEVILSRQGSRICLHYSSLWHEYFSEDAVITKYFLNREEQFIIERALESADVLVDLSMDDLPKNHIYGAEYW